MRRIKKHKFTIKKLIIILILTIILIITSIYIYKYIKNNTDKYNNTNLLLGTWLYNEYGGTYVFKDDYTFIQYTNKDTTNNYCTGTYKYKYGATQNKGITIRQDENYYYYTLNLNIKKCIIMGKITLDEYSKKIYFGINKNNNIKEITFVNSDTTNKFILKKTNNN